MKKSVVVTILFLFIIGVSVVSAQAVSGMDTNQPPVVVADTQSIMLTSTTRERDYRIWVALPSSYNMSELSYPVLYLLDPQVSFLTVVEIVRWLGYWSELPELIVVGIGYPTDDLAEIARLREQDYYRSSDDFLEFISKELIHFIDSTYRTDSKDRALVGFSYGGDFVFHTLLNRPELFNRYLTIDSGIVEILPYLTRRSEEFREKFDGLDVKLFIAMRGTERLSTDIEALKVEGLKAAGLSLGNITHAAALHTSLPAGIVAIYRNNP